MVADGIVDTLLDPFILLEPDLRVANNNGSDLALTVSDRCSSSISSKVENILQSRHDYSQLVTNFHVGSSFIFAIFAQ